jgi:uncharacterized protein (TIGR02646 family)
MDPYINRALPGSIFYSLKLTAIMIKIDRPASIPKIFNHPSIKAHRKALEKFYLNTPKADRQQRKPPNKKLDSTVLSGIMTELDKVFHGRCAYCESTVKLDSYGAFDHFRPRFGARGLRNEFSPNHYWRLSFDWRNMYLCCADCNKFKLNWFPVKGKRSSARDYEKIVRDENNLFVDPCGNDLLHGVFAYELSGWIKSEPENGRKTIDILELNRSSLLSARKDIIVQFNQRLERLQKIWDGPKPTVESATKTITEMTDYLATVIDEETRIPFLSVHWWLLELWMEGPSGFGREIFYYVTENIKPAHVHPLVFQILENQKAPGLKQLLKKKYTDHGRIEFLKNIDILPQYRSTDTERIFINKITVRNYKAIEEIRVEFPPSVDKSESWIVLLGENSVGKSSFLQAVALALVGEDYIQKLNKIVSLEPKDLLRHGETDGSVEIFATGYPRLRTNRKTAAMLDPESENGLIDPIRLEIDKQAVLPAGNLKKSGTFVFGYGSTRLLPTGKLRPERTQGKVRIVNLFDPGTALQDATKWLISIKNKKIFDRVCLALRTLLSLKEEDQIVRDKKGVYIIFDYSTGKAKKKTKSKKKAPKKKTEAARSVSKIKLEELSDGYKSVIAVSVDMMQTLIKANTPIESAEGIVLLDEIGTHLHPRWRMEVVGQFKFTFPKLQFIVTTHDPLCLRGLKKGEVIVLKRDEHNKIYSLDDLPDPSEFRVDQLLNSEFFGLKSTIDPKVEAQFNEYYDLLRKEDRLKPKEKERMKFLKDEVTGKRHLGNSLREELAFDAVDTLLAKETIQGGTVQREELKEKTSLKLQELWNNILEKGKKDDKAGQN